MSNRRLSAVPFTALTATLTAAALGLATLAGAQGMDPADAAVKARQSHMFLNQYNLMTLGAMAQGAIPYDAAAASTAAANLLALSSMEEQRYFLPGTSTAERDDTRALPAIWENLEDVTAKANALNAAAEAMAAAAGTDLTALQGAMGALGGACSACHESYRVPD